MERPRGRLVSFFSHPAVGIAGTVASVVGLLLAIYFFFAGQRRPALSAYVYPIRATVIKVGEASTLGVTLRGVPIQTDVTAVQVAIWNGGNEPIRHADVLHPTTIKLSAPILHTSLRAVSRDVARMTIDDSRKHRGELVVRWDVLEQNDGGVIQIMYAGPPTVNIATKAVVVGQPRMQIVAAPDPSADRTELDLKSSRTGWMFIAVGVIMPGLILLITWRIWETFYRRAKLVVVAMVIMAVLYVALGLIIILRSQTLPPFAQL